MMAVRGVDISGLVKGMAEARRRVQAAAVRAVDHAGEHVIGKAQQKTPVDTGFLQNSATTLPAGVADGGNRVTKLIGFNASYAAAVHENLTAHHQVGQAKFLESAVNEEREKVKQFVVDETRRALK